MERCHGWHNSHSGRSLEQELLMPAAESFRQCCAEQPEARQLPLGQKTPTGKWLTRESTFQPRELLPKHFSFPALELTWPGKKAPAPAAAQAAWLGWSDLRPAEVLLGCFPEWSVLHSLARGHTRWVVLTRGMIESTRFTVRLLFLLLRFRYPD
jgi:hypothetical protein